MPDMAIQSACTCSKQHWKHQNSSTDFTNFPGLFFVGFAQENGGWVKRSLETFLLFAALQKGIKK